VRWETKQSFDGQLYQEYLYQNLLKLDDFSSSYDEKNLGVFFYASQYISVCLSVSLYVCACLLWSHVDRVIIIYAK